MESFNQNLLPGNYWITKSMEFSKESQAGTLWYLKKWFVYYYFIFFNDPLHDNVYEEIIKNFDSFIQSLPEEVQEAARDFFYSVDIRDKKRVMRFYEYVKDRGGFANEKDQILYLNEAKKYYFMYLMDIGGQAGYKKQIKELLYEHKTHNEVLGILKDTMKKDGMTDIDIRTQVSDFPATIRNERQIFFYYGFFFGRDRADLSGFYRLTPVGKSVLYGNFHEVCIVWEHQKIKMLSQSPFTIIKNISEIPGHSVENFDINTHPYFNLLKALDLRKILDLDWYKFILARTRDTDNLTTLVHETEGGFEETKEIIEKFGRIADIKDEDFRKELKKFVLGITNQQKDSGTNPSAIISTENGSIFKISNKERFDFTLDNYKTLVNYLDEGYQKEYSDWKDFISKNYKRKVKGKDLEEDLEITYGWGKYIINFDKGLLLALVYIRICLIVGQFDFKLSQAVLKKGISIFPYFKKVLGYSSTELLEVLTNTQDMLREEVYKPIIDLEELLVEDVDYSVKNLEELSALISRDASNSRSSELIKNLRNYYLKNFTQETTGLIPCDVCTKTTFKNKNNKPYLEFHHIIPFSTDNGPDHHLNLVGICSECHRKLTHGDRETRIPLYRDLSKNNNLGIGLLDRMTSLFDKGLLEPINIEFLRKEEIIDDRLYEKFMN